MYQPDQTDWRIIALLNEDGRMSSAEIARRLGDISARTVKNRVENLTNQNIINIRTIVNPESVGFDVYADIFIEVIPGKVREVAKTLAEYPQISYVACATGATDIIVSVRARNLSELYNFVIEEVGQIPGVRHTQTYPLHHKLKSLATWMPPGIISHGENSL